MNKDRRKTINEAIDQLQSAMGLLEMARDEEQEYFDMMPENFQDGEKGQAAEEAVDQLSEAIDSIENAAEVARGVSDT